MYPLINIQITPSALIADPWTYQRWKADEALLHVSDDQFSLKYAQLAASCQKQQKMLMKNTALLLTNLVIFPELVQMAMTIIISEVIMHPDLRGQH